MKLEQNKWVEILLRLSTFAVFLGRAWQHLFWDAPFRALLWDQELLSPVINLLTPWTWTDYVTSLYSDFLIDCLIQSSGLYYLVCAIASLVLKRESKYKWILIVGAFNLFFLSFLYFIDSGFRVGQIIEYSSHTLSPLILYFFLKGRFQLVSWSILWAISLTFLGHGLYAIGYYPVPGKFIDMTIRILHISEPSALHLLFFAGILDMIVAIGVFISHSARLRQIIFLWAIIWGALTALARVWDKMDGSLLSLHSSLYESVYRVPHFIIPLLGLIIFTHMPARIRLLWSEKRLVK